MPERIHHVSKTTNFDGTTVARYLKSLVLSTVPPLKPQLVAQRLRLFCSPMFVLCRLAPVIMETHKRWIVDGCDLACLFTLIASLHFHLLTALSLCFHIQYIISDI